MIEKIPIPNENFKDVLSNNSKILFSGIFGSGKTTFINDFFEDNDSYEAIHIYPVNYSIASNVDIFELIKYDILFQLIGKLPKEDFLKLDIPYHLTLYNYLFSFNNLNKKVDFLSSFLHFAGKYGSASLKIYESIKHLKDEFVKFHKSFQEDDFNKVKSYLENLKNEKGSIYEEDFFTELIRILIFKLKDKNKKEVILVIDDLDRLDPEHIFRILNIFSAHIDFSGVENDNKFDFDKVIIVCDYANIESLYKHKYGIGTDFKGYINKFFNEIFWYDVATLIKAAIDTYLSKVKTNIDGNIFNEDYRFSDQVKYVLFTFLDSGIISFRDLISFKNGFDTNRFYPNKKRNLAKVESILKRYNLTVELTINFLISFFGNNNELLNAIGKAKNKNNQWFSYLNQEDYFNNIAEFVLLIKHETFNTNRLGVNNKNLNLKSYDFNLNVSSKDYRFYTECNEIKKQDNQQVKPDELNYFEFLEEATKVYLEIIN
ncbi:P-loop NTPase fold protein [Neotamlana laminarinivorans]|uniref:KAP family NTPase n=1 Tax=Neotamlana laminarinivorans TaxID=2883124 RepID=A0A9X1I458_9FLAO|nr:P-loop NTPase fold protein [Tamlana laminarinivorans]MCB4799877.1 KAP family NTPase [Tamlana laminarinivorans]